MFYKTISTLHAVSEDVLVYIYTGIFEVSEEIDKGKSKESEEKIKKMAEVLMAITKQDEQEREKE
jgi:hypothetical protein